jgi:hypothetical protein
LWTVNFHAPLNLDGQNCIPSDIEVPYIDGYESQSYHCTTATPSTER